MPTEIGYAHEGTEASDSKTETKNSTSLSCQILICNFWRKLDIDWYRLRHSSRELRKNINFDFWESCRRSLPLLTTPRLTRNVEGWHEDGTTNSGLDIQHPTFNWLLFHLLIVLLLFTIDWFAIFTEYHVEATTNRGCHVITPCSLQWRLNQRHFLADRNGNHRNPCWKTAFFNLVFYYIFYLCYFISLKMSHYDVDCFRSR